MLALLVCVLAQILLPKFALVLVAINDVNKKNKERDGSGCSIPFLTNFSEDEYEQNKTI
jgi:hypothetical protein